MLQLLHTTFIAVTLSVTSDQLPRGDNQRSDNKLTRVRFPHICHSFHAVVEEIRVDD